MEACSEDIMRAITSKDSKHLALALQAAMDCYNASNDEDSNDFESQNEKAAKDME